MESLLPFVVSGLGIGAVYALSGVGLVVLYRATGVLNFAYGALGAVAAFLTWALMDGGVGWFLAVPVGIAASTLLSILFGFLIASRLAYRDRVVRAVGTLGFALILLGLIGWYFGDAPRRILVPTDKMFFEVFGARLTYTRALALIVAVAIVGGIGLLLVRTRLGLAMRALADSREVSSVLGIRIVWVEATAWLISGAFAGLSGVFLGDLVRLQAQLLTFLVIPAIAAAIVGRLSSLWLTALAGVVIGLCEALLTPFDWIAPYRTAVPFLIALAAIALRPTPPAVQET